MKATKDIWTTPKEMGNRVRTLLPYHKGVTVFNDQTSKAGQVFYLTINVSLLRRIFLLRSTKKALINILEVGMQIGRASCRERV